MLSSPFFDSPLFFAGMPRRPGEILRDRLRDLVPRGQAARISALAGMSAETFSLWKNERRYPNPELSELERLAEALQVSPAYLISEASPADCRPSSEEVLPPALIPPCRQVLRLPTAAREMLAAVVEALLRQYGLPLDEVDGICSLDTPSKPGSADSEDPPESERSRGA